MAELSRLRYASEWLSSGYGIAARRCLQSLSHCPIDLAWEPLLDTDLGRLRTTQSGSAPAGLRAMRKAFSDDEALVLHSVPRSWNAVAADIRPKHIIGHTVWETEQIPTPWLREMDLVDEFWVPTRWNQRTFEETFHRPVHLVPYVAATAEPSPPPVVLREGDFVVATIAEWTWRKRPDRTVAAFVDAFDADDAVTLVVKTSARAVDWPGDHRSMIHIARLLARKRRPPRVIVDTGQWSDAQILGLLERADCFLSLTASEGWGLGAFDAACLGTPVIITGYGGPAEWLGLNYPGLLTYQLADAHHPGGSILFEPGMQWADPDHDAAVQQLRQLAGGTAADLVGRAAALAPELRELYSPESVAVILDRVLPERLVRRAEPTMSRLIHP
jgi:glycosyltransferase involved in cell wall biosynthesis